MTKIIPNQNSNFLKLHKKQALKDIQNSIKEWNDFKEKNLFNQIFSRQKKSIHWEASNIRLNLFHVHLKWSKNIIRSQTNIERKEVLGVLLRIQEFYSKISIINPDLTHPDIISCYNLTAKEKNLEQIKIKFKDRIEINFFDPFNNVLGKEMKNIEQTFYREKKVALKNIKYALDFINQIENKLDKVDSKKIENPENLVFDKLFSNFEVKFLWCGKELESYKNLTKKDVKKKLNEIKIFINYFNILRPNLSDPLVNKMYKCFSDKNTTNFFFIQNFKRKFDSIKKNIRGLLINKKAKLKKKKYFIL